MKDDGWRTGKMLVNGITVAYDDVGEGDNVLVLVHGHPFNRTIWRAQMELLNRPPTRRRPRPRCGSGSGSESVVEAEREREADSIAVPLKIFEDEDDDEYEDEGEPLRSWRIIVPDLRGYGESTVVPGKTTLDIFASDIAGLLDELGIQDVVI
jgi:pimeloyl-ACP methyl ester carboxylesterase